MYIIILHHDVVYGKGFIRHPPSDSSNLKFSADVPDCQYSTVKVDDDDPHNSYFIGTIMRFGRQAQSQVFKT
jgi:hypothetical protein